MKLSTSDNVKVFIRVRPKNDKEANTDECIKVNGQSIAMADGEVDHRFAFDHVFGPDSTQKQVY